MVLSSATDEADDRQVEILWTVVKFGIISTFLCFILVDSFQYHLYDTGHLEMNHCPSLIKRCLRSKTRKRYQPCTGHGIYR